MLSSCCPSFFHRFFDTFLHRFLVDFPPQLGSENRSKSTKNRCQDALHVACDFLIDFCSQLRPPGSQKSVFFLRKNKVFSKNGLSKITSISASILVPTCLHVGLQNRRFSDFWRFQEAFKISSFFASIFYRFWLRLGLQHGAILGAKTAQNLKKWDQKFGMVLPKSGSGYDFAFEHRLRAFWHRFGGVRARFSEIFG